MAWRGDSGDRDVTSTVPLNTLLKRVDDGPLHDRLAAPVALVMSRIPLSEYRRARLEVLVYRAVTMNKGDPAALKKRFREHLRREAGDIVHALPGRGVRHDLFGFAKTVWSPSLDRLLDRDLWKPFILVSALSPALVSRPR